MDTEILKKLSKKNISDIKKLKNTSEYKMFKIKNVNSIIPAKTGSKRIINKNI